MKTILVPTDFSEVANNATRYAIELSKQFDAKVIFFHAYHRYPLLSSLPLIFSDIELEKVYLEEIKAEEYRVKHECFCNQVQTESLVYRGNTIDGILEVIKKNNVDCIVMGITGSSKIAEILIGSNAISVIKKTKIPVFIIPKDAKFKKIEKFIFVHNYDEPTPENVTEEIKMFCNKFKPEIIIYGKPELQGVENFKEVNSFIDTEFAKSGASTINHILTFSKDGDQTEEINSFVEFYKADILAMMPDISKSFTKIFRSDNTTSMAFHTHLPLLILHDNEQKD